MLHRASALRSGPPLRILPACVLAFLVAACGGAGSAATTRNVSVSLQAMQIQSSDLPSGFYLAGRSHLAPGPTARSQGLDHARYLRHGGEMSVAERFVLQHPATIGLTFIFSQVFAFRSPGNATWGFHQLRSILSRSGTIGTVQQTVNVSATPTPLPTIIKSIPHPVPSLPTLYRSVKVPPLGDEDAGFSNDSDAYAGEYVFTNQVILFRRGRYCAIVHISGNYAQVPLHTALAFSRLIDRRIQRSRSRG